MFVILSVPVEVPRPVKVVQKVPVPQPYPVERLVPVKVEKKGKSSSADPESFARGGPPFFDKGKEDLNSTKSGPFMAYHWQADYGPTLNAGLSNKC